MRAPRKATAARRGHQESSNQPHAETQSRKRTVAILSGSMGREQARPSSHHYRRGTSFMEGGGAYFLDWREGGKRIRKKVGTAPREALDAWRKSTGVANGSIPADASEKADGTTDATGISIQEGVSRYLGAVKATKGDGTHSSYESCLRWAERHITKHLVYLACPWPARSFVPVGLLV